MAGQRDHATYMGGRNRNNIQTPLGSICHEKGITALALCQGTGINPRTLSDYLGNKVPIRTHHMPVITAFLGVTPAELTREPEGGWEGQLEKIRARDARPEHGGVVKDIMRPVDAGGRA